MQDTSETFKLVICWLEKKKHPKVLFILLEAWAYKAYILARKSGTHKECWILRRDNVRTEKWNRFLTGRAIAEFFFFCIFWEIYTFQNCTIVEQECLKLKDRRGWLSIPVQVLRLLCSGSTPVSWHPDFWVPFSGAELNTNDWLPRAFPWWICRPLKFIMELIFRITNY